MDDLHLDSGHKVDGRWAVGKLLGQGSFGAVYEAVDSKKAIPSTGGHMALKLESVQASDQVLKVEVTVLRTLSYSKHACHLYAAGKNDRFSFILMSILGPSLHDLQKKLGGKFSRTTTLLLGRQCLHAIKDMHDVGWLHRDVKPSNFAIGTQPYDRRTVYIFDFGLARTYWNKERHVRAPRPKAGFRGTVLYCSLNAHKRLELGRHDDIISLLYTLSEFNTGKLPWKGVDDKEEVEISKQTSGSLYSGLLPSLDAVHAHLYSLRYRDVPNYAMYERCLTYLMTAEEINVCEYDWEATGHEHIAIMENTATRITKVTIEGVDDDNANLPDLPQTNYKELRPSNAQRKSSEALHNTTFK